VGPNHWPLPCEGDFWVVAVAKSGKTRHIPLNKEAYAILEKWYEQNSESILVFPSRNGERFDNIKSSWEKLLIDAKIQNFRFHDLRHHFASKLVMAAVDLNTVRELLGHADIQMTLRYAHLAPEYKARAVEKLIGLVA
jgi:integrase